MMSKLLPDTRPYPAEEVKNELLSHALALARPAPRPQKVLAGESLHAVLGTMLAQKQLLPLSVALSMAPDAAVYRVLWQAMDNVLAESGSGGVSWCALPLVLVAGCNGEVVLSGGLETDGLAGVLAGFPETAGLAGLNWLPYVVSAEQLAGVRPDIWYGAYSSKEAAEQLAGQLGVPEIRIPSGQSVHMVYIVGYGQFLEAMPSLGQAALPMMQYWQQHFSAQGLTLFVNPLDAATPLNAISEGSHMRQRMALEVFSANAIRAIRLQSPRVGVLAAALAGGVLAFSFQSAEKGVDLMPQVFYWQLSPTDCVDTVVQNFVDLMVECRVEHIRLLHDPLQEGEALPDYVHSWTLPGFNPLFAAEH